MASLGRLAFLPVFVIFALLVIGLPFAGAATASSHSVPSGPSRPFDPGLAPTTPADSAIAGVPVGCSVSLVAGCPAGAYTTGLVTYHGGPVMHDPVNYLIFWLPSGYSFDNPSIDLTASNSSNSNYEALIERYFNDIGGSSFYNILQQYTDESGAPGTGATLGGVYIDTHAFPGGTGSQGDPITDADLQDEVYADTQTNGWNSNNGNNEFFIFTPYDVYTQDYSTYCAYHTWFTMGSTPYIYAVMPDAGTDYGPGVTCLITLATGDSQTPNDDPLADSMISLLAHEQFESVSDPQPYSIGSTNYGGWFYLDGEHEIADECAWQFGPRSSNGGDVVLNGDSYLVQYMWSNSAGGCYLPSLPSGTMTTSITLLPAGQSTPLSASNKFKMTYSLNGVNETTYYAGGTMNLQVDVNTNVIVSAYSSASSSTEKWVFDSQDQAVSIQSGASVTLYYYDLLAQNASYSVVGGGTPTPPNLLYSTAPPNLSSSSSPVSYYLQLSQTPQQIWSLRGTGVSVPETIPGGNSEQWATPQSGWTSSSSSQLPAHILYYHQFQVLPAFQVSGSPGAGSPSITCEELGSSAPVQSGLPSWVDAGSSCTYSSLLPDSSQSERWFTPTQSVTISGPGTVSETYYQQYEVDVSYQVVGGGQPGRGVLSGTFTGVPIGISVPSGGALEWLDAGSAYSMAQYLSPLSSSERWMSPSPIGGTVTGPVSISPTYYHQYLVSALFTVVGGGTPSSPSLSYVSFGKTGSLQLTTSGQNLWTDVGSQYSVPIQLGSSTPGERWSTSASAGTVSSDSSIDPTYFHQFLLSVQEGGQTSDHWFNATSTASLSVPGVYGRASGSGERVVSYSIDGGSATKVQPTTAGITISVLMDSSHTLTITSVSQYRVRLDGTANDALASITPPTIAGDQYWYDKGTPVTVVLNGAWGRSGGTGLRLVSYTLDGTTTDTAAAGQIQALSTSSISSPANITASMTTQFELTTSSGAVATITPATPIPGDGGWYDNGTSIIVRFDYSWNTTDGEARSNAVAFSIDNGPSNGLTRSGSGTFSVGLVMSGPHHITVESITQYQLTIVGGNDIVLSARSPTNDSFYDSGSSLTISSDLTWNLVNGDSRFALQSYSLDGVVTNVTASNETGAFTIPPVSFTTFHQVVFDSVTQYLVTFQFSDSTGTRSITPTAVQLQLNDPSIVDVPNSAIWLNVGSVFQIYEVEWEGTNVAPANQAVYSVNGPLNEKVLDRVYSGDLSAIDYLGIPISGAKVSITLANGTTVTRMTGNDGSIDLGEIPLGSYLAKVSYLGSISQVNGDASAASNAKAKLLSSYPTFAVIGISIALVIAAVLVAMRRHAGRITISRAVTTPLSDDDTAGRGAEPSALSCPVCGVSNDASSVFCENCGRKLR